MSATDVAAASTAGRRALAEALRHVGVKEHPPGSNRTMFGRWFGVGRRALVRDLRLVLLRRRGRRRRSAAVGTAPVQGRAASRTSRRSPPGSARRAGSATGPPRPGDIAVYDWDGGVPDHVGIVIRRTAGGIDTVEGNTAIGNDSDGGRGDAPPPLALVGVRLRPRLSMSSPRARRAPGRCAPRPRRRANSAPAIENAAATWVGSPSMKPRPDSSRNVSGFRRATPWIQPCRAGERHVDRREEEREEDRRLHQRPGLRRAEAHRDAAGPEQADLVEDDREREEAEQVDAVAADLHVARSARRSSARRRSSASGRARRARSRG